MACAERTARDTAARAKDSGEHVRYLGLTGGRSPCHPALRCLVNKNNKNERKDASADDSLAASSITGYKPSPGGERNNKLYDV